MATLRAKLLMDQSDFSKGLQDAERTLSNAGAKMKAVGQTMSLAVTLPLVAAGTAAAKLAIDAEETASKFNTVLGPAAARVDAEIGKMMKTIPATREELRAGVADMTMLGQAAGLTAAEATNLSTKFVTAAADLGSFNNVPVDQALEAIRSGLVGSSEPLRAFGIDTREAALEAIALEQGLMQAGEEMTAATRAAAVMAAIQQDASDAMGDAARTAESTANIMKFLKRDVLELATGIGEQLIPIIRPLIEKAGEWLAKFRDLSPEAQKMIVVIGGIAAAIGPLLIVGGTLVTALGAIVGAVAAVSAPVLAVIAVVGTFAAALATAYAKSETFRDIVNGAFTAVIETVRPILDELKETVVVVLEDIERFWTEHGAAIMAIVEPALTTLGIVIETLMKTIGKGIEFALNVIQGDWDEAHLNLLDTNEIFSTALVRIFDTMKGLLITIAKAIWAGIKAEFWAEVENIKAAPKALFEAVAGILNNMKATAITIVKSMWADIKAVFTGAIDGVRQKMEDVHNTVVGAFQRIKDIVVTRSIWPDMWDEIAGVVNTATPIIDGLLNDWKTTLMGIFDDISGGLIGKVTTLWSSIQNIFSGGIANILTNIGSLIPQVTDLWNTVTGLVSQASGLLSGGAAAVGGGAAAVASGGTAVAGGGVVGVGGTAGGLSTGAGIPTIGTGTAGSAGGGLLANAAGAALVPGIALGASFGGEWLSNQLFGEWIDWTAKSFQPGGAAYEQTQAYNEWQDLITKAEQDYQSRFGQADYLNQTPTKDVMVTVESPDIYLDGHLVSGIVGRDLTTSILISGS